MGSLSFLNRIKQNVVNIPGWSTSRKIVVFESDDWGSIRVRSNNDTQAMRQMGFNLDNTSFYQYDALECNEDLSGLFEVLSRYKDFQGNNPIFTLVSNVANPVFEKIKESDFTEYFWEPFTETLKRYPKHDKVYALHKEGIECHLTYPVFHGREHLYVRRWMRLLQQGNESALVAFEHGACSNMYGINGEYLGELPAAFDLEFASDLNYLHSVIREGLVTFKQLWGFRAKYFVAPNGPFNNLLEKDLFDNGVEYLLGEKRQNEPWGDGQYRRHYRWMGKKNNLGQIYLARNCFFEPGIIEGGLCNNPIERGLKTIERAFRWHKPAIISSHRVNFVGFLNPQQREHGLDLLDKFLAEIIKRWPDVEFMSSVELGDIMAGKRK